jgi:hypothetical protein
MTTGRHRRRQRGVLSAVVRRRAAAIGGLFAVALAAPAVAAVPVDSKKLVVIDYGRFSDRSRIVYVSKDRTAGITKGPATDPDDIRLGFFVRYGNDATLGIFIVPYGAGHDTVGWFENSDRMARYRNVFAPFNGAQTKLAVVRPGKLLKLVTKGLGEGPLSVRGAGDPGGGGVHTGYCVTNGGLDFCHCSTFADCRFRSIGDGTGAKLSCRHGRRDPDCQFVPPTLPTTTSTSTTSTTSTSTTSTTSSTTTTMYCFADQGLTILDTCRSVVWEKKTTASGSGANPSDLHDVDNLYSWAGLCTLNPDRYCQPNAAAAATCTLQTGGVLGCETCDIAEGSCDVDVLGQGVITTIWDWINQVNATGFAGQDDWRIPTSAGGFSQPTGDPAELEVLRDPSQAGCGGPAGPCIDPILGPTHFINATGSSDLLDSSFGAFVGFFDVLPPTLLLKKTQSAGIRAVRDVASPPVGTAEATVP